MIEITDAMVQAALMIESPALYRDGLGKPSDGEHTRARIAKDIKRATAMLRAALAAAPAQPVAGPGDWLRDSATVYRLTDERRPTNRDEIHVAMVDGSRDLVQRGAQAERILSLLAGAPAQPVAATLTKWAARLDPVQTDWEAGYEAARAYVKMQLDCGPAQPPAQAQDDDSLTAAYMSGSHDAKRARKPLTDEQIDDLLGDANRGYCIEAEHYFKAFRDAEAAHGIT